MRLTLLARLALLSSCFVLAARADAPSPPRRRPAPRRSRIRS
ncbi:hypothetical protein [Oleiharenicola sp. Vm1]